MVLPNVRNLPKPVLKPSNLTNLHTPSGETTNHKGRRSIFGSNVVKYLDRTIISLEREQGSCHETKRHFIHKHKRVSLRKEVKTDNIKRKEDVSNSGRRCWEVLISSKGCNSLREENIRMEGA